MAADGSAEAVLDMLRQSMRKLQGRVCFGWEFRTGLGPSPAAQRPAWWQSRLKRALGGTVQGSPDDRFTLASQSTCACRGSGSACRNNREFNIKSRPTGRKVADECSTWNWCGILQKASACQHVALCLHTVFAHGVALCRFQVIVLGELFAGPSALQYERTHTACWCTTQHVRNELVASCCQIAIILGMKAPTIRMCIHLTNITGSRLN